MTTLMKRDGAPFTGLFDWLETGWPTVAEWRGLVPGGIRIEDYAEGDRYVMRAELPAIDPDKDVTITVQDGVLTLSAERREQVAEKHRSEFRYGSFARQVVLPRGARESDIAATYKDGILEVSVPLSEPGPEARSIPITRGAE